MDKQKINKYFYILTIVTFLLVCTIPTITVAEVTRTKLNNVDPANDFAVGPGKTEVVVNPGETVTRTVSITSRVQGDVDFVISLEDFVGSNDPSQTVVLLGEGKSPYSLKDFLSPEISSFTLSFGERITIPITISIPADAEPRGYYGAVLVSNRPSTIDPATGTDTAEGKTTLVSRVGSLFLLRVNGAANESGRLTSFDLVAPKKKVYTERPKGFEILFQNEGNVHLVPYGEISIKNILNREVGRLPVDAYFVLPESIRARQIFWNDSFFGIGRYEATISLYKGYGNENDLEEETIVFWVFPWKIVLPIFVGLVILITLIHYIISRFEIKRKR